LAGYDFAAEVDRDSRATRRQGRVDHRLTGFVPTGVATGERVLRWWSVPIDALSALVATVAVESSFETRPSVFVRVQPAPLGSLKVYPSRLGTLWNSQERR
jgi:hypothetical protein